MYCSLCSFPKCNHSLICSFQYYIAGWSKLQVFVLNHFFLRYDSYLNFEIKRCYYKAFVCWSIQKVLIQCKVLERDFEKHVKRSHLPSKHPSPFHSPVRGQACAGLPWLLRTVTTKARAWGRGEKWKIFSWESSTFRNCSRGLLWARSCRRHREAAWNGGEEPRISSLLSIWFQECCPCGKWITGVVRRSKQSDKTKKVWIWHYFLTDHRPKPPVAVFLLAVTVPTQNWELWVVWNVEVRPLSCLCASRWQHCFAIPPSPQVFPEYLCHERLNELFWQVLGVVVASVLSTGAQVLTALQDAAEPASKMVAPLGKYVLKGQKTPQGEEEGTQRGRNDTGNRKARGEGWGKWEQMCFP